MKSLLLIAAVTLACVEVNPDPEYAEARHLIEASTGRSEVFDPALPRLDGEELASMLADGLSLEEAMRLALVHNRELQAEFQEIGIANADWVQAQLHANPTLDVLLRFPSDGGRSMLEGILGLDLLDLWRVPKRTEAARHELNATVLRIAFQASERLAETRQAYFAAVAAEELLSVAEENLQLATRWLEAMQSLRAAGAGDAYDESLARGPWLSAQLHQQTLAVAAAEAKRELAKGLSLGQNIDALLLCDPLPSQSVPDFESETLVRIALESRHDLKAIEASVLALDSQVRLEEHRAFGELSAGPGVERPAGRGGSLIGPSLSLSLPILDRNQAQVARRAHELERRVQLHANAQVLIAQDVRSSAARVNAASRALEFYSQELLPHAQRSLDLIQASHGAGHASLEALIDAQARLLDVRAAQVRLRLEAAHAGAELKQALGAPIPASAASAGH